MTNSTSLLRNYFNNLINRLENSDEITNAGKDENGFYKPKRTILLRHLQLLRDLHDKPLARSQVQAAWRSVVKELPPEWLILNEDEKRQLKLILQD